MRPSGRAFTLIETLVALVIFASAGVCLMSVFVSALEARQRSVSKDLFHADVRAVRMQLLLEPNIEDAEAGGSFATLAHGEASWQARIEPTNLVDLFRVALSIEFPESRERGPPIIHNETLYLLRPTWAEGDERSDLLEDKRDALLDSRHFDRF